MILIMYCQQQQRERAGGRIQLSMCVYDLESVLCLGGG